MKPRALTAKSWLTCHETGARIAPGSRYVLYFTPQGRKVFSTESRQFQIYQSTKHAF